MISLERQRRLDGYSRAYVVGNGKKSGHEYLIGYCQLTGKILVRNTSNKPGAVKIPKHVVPVLKNKRNRFVLHHNHPVGSSFSLEDLYNLAKLPGTVSKWVHGHETQWYKAETLRERNFLDKINAADGSFQRCLMSSASMLVLPEKFLNHIFNIGLDKAKLIRYTFHLSPTWQLEYNSLNKDELDTLLQSVTVGVSLTRSKK